MKIAFYCPLKSPNHPVPSGDRLMGRLLMAALEMAGHGVAVASELRSFNKDPEGASRPGIQAAATAEIDRLSAFWNGEGRPDVWFCYHLYYKAPDLIGPRLSKLFGLSYVTAEASYSERRNVGGWERAQAGLLDGVNQAAVNICFTERDRLGLRRGAPAARLAMLPPFLDPAPFVGREPQPEPGHLVAVAMMRPGDKMDSYRMLAAALAGIADLPWTLSIAGDGDGRAELEALFSGFAPGRVIFLGQQTPDQVATLLARAALYVWPGCGEAYGLAYLEAQAAGVPVVAQAIAGVPSVVAHGRTGLLTPPGDVAAYGLAIARLLAKDRERQAMAQAARTFVTGERSISRAAARLDAILHTHVRPRA